MLLRSDLSYKLKNFIIILSDHFIFSILPQHISKLSEFLGVQVSVSYKAMLQT